MIFKKFSHAQRNKRVLWNFLNLLLLLSSRVDATTDCQQVTEIPTEECQALVEFYQAVQEELYQPIYEGNGRVDFYLNWNVTNTPCSWTGITCEKGHVQKLLLNSKFLAGSITDLSALTQLQELRLDSNRLTGPIPNLDSFSQLQRLSLNNNKLVGPIPHLNALSQLNELNLSNNQLVGQIPDLSTLSQLQYLNLSHNQLSGSIPNLNALSQLQFLYLEKNNLTGSIPDLTTLSQLGGLNLAHNQLTGPIPDLTFPYLKSLSLEYNHLTGPSPDLSGLPNLFRINLSHNDLTELDCHQVTQIPEEECQTLLELYDSTDGPHWIRDFGDWKIINQPCIWTGIFCLNGHVETISLPNNQLKGPFPNLSALSQLRILDLSGNQLTGPIPDLSTCSQLATLNLSDNQLTGPIPDLSTCSQLATLNLSGNQLTGSIPDLTALLRLYTLFLSNNQLSGPIPSLSTLSQLGYLILDHNQLSGPVPDLSALSQLSSLHLSDNQLSGPIPNLTMLPRLKKLSLSNNYFVSSPTNCDRVTQIPKTECETLLNFYHSTHGENWADKSGWNANNLPCFLWVGVTCRNGHVQKLAFSNHHLSGQLPDLSPLSQLRVLVLDHNQLEGVIPNLSALSQLREVNLAYNHLSGTIPDFSTLSQLEVLFLDHNNLSGELPDISSFPPLTRFSLSGNHLAYQDIQCEHVTQIPKEECETLLAFYHSTHGENWKSNRNWNLTHYPCYWEGIRCEDGHVFDLILDDNQLTGSLPDLAALTDLHTLSLQNNALSGSLPDLTSLTQLQSLYLRNNKLTGSFPDLNTFSSLSFVSLSGNQLTHVGTQCDQVTQIPQKECETLLALYDSTYGEYWQINFSWNITDTPCSWWGIACQNGHVQEIYLGGNRLHGSIPDLGALSQLHVLSLAGKGPPGEEPSYSTSPNELTGPIPDLSMLTQLRHIDLSDNRLSGQIPNLSMLSQLNQLSLRNNQLCGEIPIWLSTLKHLNFLDLNHNHLTFPSDPHFIEFLHEYWEDENTQTPSDSCVTETTPATSKPPMITLITFSATLVWSMETNQERIGFRLWRGQPVNGLCNNDPNNYFEVKSLASVIPSAEELSTLEITSTYVDTDMQNGTVYCYALEEIFQGGGSLFHLEKIVPVKGE